MLQCLELTILKLVKFSQICVEPFKTPKSLSFFKKNLYSPNIILHFLILMKKDQNILIIFKKCLKVKIEIKRILDLKTKFSLLFIAIKHHFIKGHKNLKSKIDYGIITALRVIVHSIL